MELFGTHGTVESLAENIINSEFNIGKGRGGTGIYFWRKNEYSIILAEGWHEFYLNKNKYDNVDKKNFAYINVKIDVEEKNFLDLELAILKDKIAKIAYNKGMKRNTSEEDITALYDYFINRLEEELQTKFYVWQLRVNAPYTANDYPLSIIGNPICYVVNSNDLITILECYIKEGNNERQIL